MTFQLNAFPPPEFGAISAEIKNDLNTQRFRLGFAVLLVPLGLAILFTTLLYALWVKLPIGLEVLVALALLAIGASLFGIGIWIIAHLMVHWEYALYLCDKGLALQDGKKQFLLGWGDIQAVRTKAVHHYQNGVYHSSSWFFWVKDFNGNSHPIENFPAQTAQAVFITAQEKSYSQRLQAAVTRLNRGEIVWFGKAGLSKAGVHSRKAHIPFNGLYSAIEKNSVYSFRSQKGAKLPKLLSFPDHQLENADVFWALLNYQRALNEITGT